MKNRINTAQFEMSRPQKNGLLGVMGFGVLCMIIIMITDGPGMPRFWSNFLLNSVFFTGIGFVALFAMSSMITAYSGWHVAFKRVWEAYSLFLIVGLVLMLIIIIGIFGGFHYLYEWADKDVVAGDKILIGKSGFLNPVMYTLFTIIFVGGGYWFASRMRALSLEEDRSAAGDYSAYGKLKRYAAGFLPFGAFISVVAIWLWIMSVDAHWYSTIFAWYATSSWFVAFLCLTVLLLYYLKYLGYFPEINANHFHDLGKYIFAFSIFWAYLWFSQYMLIWYGNIGEETIYFKTQLTEYRMMFFVNLILNFLIPFFVLIRNDTKRKIGTMVFASIILLFGHWLDFFLMIKPGVNQTYQMMTGGEGFSSAVGGSLEAAGTMVAEAAQSSEFINGFTFPGVLDIGVFLGFLALFVYFAMIQLGKAKLSPVGDPYIGESFHHHVQ